VFIRQYQWIALETGIDLKATISDRTPPEPPQLWLIGMARERLPFDNSSKIASEAHKKDPGESFDPPGS
jgi:hypothetical protein